VLFVTQPAAPYAAYCRQLLDWSNQYGGIYRLKFLWQDALVVTDPVALAAIMGRGEGAMDKASLVYAPINRMCTPHGDANLLTSAADEHWKAIRKAVAVSFSMQVGGRGGESGCVGLP
jgi:cytochrome P450